MAPLITLGVTACALKQSPRPVEIVMVDGGSADTTHENLARLAARHDEIRLFRQPGAGAAWADAGAYAYVEVDWEQGDHKKTVADACA